MLTFDDLVDNSVGAFLADVINNDICTEPSVHVSVRAAKTSTSTRDDYSLAIKTHFG